MFFIKKKHTEDHTRRKNERKKKQDIDRDVRWEDNIWECTGHLNAPSEWESEETGDSLLSTFVLKKVHDDDQFNFNIFKSCLNSSW